MTSGNHQIEELLTWVKENSAVRQSFLNYLQARSGTPSQKIAAGGVLEKALLSHGVPVSDTGFYFNAIEDYASERNGAKNLIAQIKSKAPGAAL